MLVPNEHKQPNLDGYLKDGMPVLPAEVPTDDKQFMKDGMPQLKTSTRPAPEYAHNGRPQQPPVLPGDRSGRG